MQLATTLPPHTAPAAAAPVASNHMGSGGATDVLAARRGHVAPLPGAGAGAGTGVLAGPLPASAAGRGQSLGIAGNGVCP